MKRHTKKLRKQLEKFGILVMLFAAIGLMSQLIINVLFINKNNVVMAYLETIIKTDYTEIVKAENKTEVETENDNLIQLDENESTETESKTKNSNVSNDEIDPEELYWLSHVIMAEEEGASYENKIMCGLVVMNRVKDKDFPNTIKDVIFEKNQKGDPQYACIIPVKNKKARIWLEPNEDSIRAAKEILSGNSIKIPENVVYQSERPLGSGVYIKIGNQYYCFK